MLDRVFLKRNKRQSSDAEFSSILLVQGERVPVKRPPGRPPKDAPPPKTRVVHRVLANLSQLPADLVALIEAYCRGERISTDPPATHLGPGYGALASGLALAQAIGLERVLGTGRRGRLALFLVLARLFHRGSRLSAVRWAEDQAVAEALGLEPFDEEALYRTLEWLEQEQERIEIELTSGNKPGTLFLYDVTSSYVEGQKNELAALGYNRDGKRHKKQIVVGLLTDDQGEPLSVRVYRGNTSDPKTVFEPIRLLSERLGARRVVFVGDRGMIKAKPREALAAVGFHFLTALTTPQVRALLKRGAIQLDLFEKELAEVEHEGRRFILRLNEASRLRDRARREDQLRTVRAKVEKRNAEVRASAKRSPQVSLDRAQQLLATYRLAGFVSVQLEGREVHLLVDDAKRREVEELDGCYVLETDVPKADMSAEMADERYVDLSKVERDFRAFKTALLEMRPLFLRKASRTRGHACVVMLALKVARELERRVRDLGITIEDALARLEAIRLISYAPALRLWHLPASYEHTQQDLLDRLPPLPAPMLSHTNDPARRCN